MERPGVVFENDDFIVLNKPSGWVVNNANTLKTTYVVQDWLKNNFVYPVSKDSEYRSGIVHRLDKETSGLLLVAKKADVFLSLQVLFKERKIKKEYLALTHGKIIPEKGIIDASTGRLPWHRERFGVLSNGKEAVTEYQLINYYLNQNTGETLSLVSVKPKTGRTHQIRIHFKYLNHPIVSDSFYAGRKTSRQDKKWCNRLFLHAHSIKFRLHKDSYSFESKLPADLNFCLSFLKKL